MIIVRESIFIKFEEGVSVERMELDVDSASELPSVDFMQGHKLCQGSIAHDISTGNFYAIDSQGTWYAQDGTGAVTPAEENEANNNA